MKASFEPFWTTSSPSSRGSPRNGALLILFLTSTGVRIGEALPRDVDWLKSLSPELLIELKKAYLQWKERKLADPKTSELIFSDHKGEELKYTTVSAAWEQGLKRIGIAARGVHA